MVVMGFVGGTFTSVKTLYLKGSNMLKYCYIVVHKKYEKDDQDPASQVV